MFGSPNAGGGTQTKYGFSISLMFLKEVAFLVPRTPAEVHKKNGFSISLMFLKEIAFLVPRRPAEVHKKI